MGKGWFGAGAVLAGVIATGWGYLLRRPLPVGLPILVSLGLLLALGLVAWLAFDVFRLARAHGGDAGEDEAQVTVRVRAIGVAVLAVPLALYGVGRLRRTFAGGLPEQGEIVFGAGLVTVAAGIVLMAVVAPDFTAKPFAGMGAGAAATAAALAATSLAGATLPVEAVTAAASGPAAETVAESVSRLSWRWQVPDGTPAGQVAVAAGETLVRLGDGVVALDTRTGRERWHYRRPAAAATGFEVAPDGSTMVLTFGRAAGAEVTRGRTVVLDARTGEVRAEHAGRPFADTDPTPDGLVGIARDGTMIGRDPDDPGRRVWKRPVRKGCHVDGRVAKPYAVLRDVVAVVSDCGEETVVTGLDPADGTEVWRRETERSGRVELLPAPDLGALRLRVGARELLLDQATGRAVEDAARGGSTPGGLAADTLAADRPLAGGLAASGRVLRLKEGTLVAEVTASGPGSMTVTARCNGTDIPFDMAVDGGPGGRFTLLPAAGGVVVAFSRSATIVGLA
ncbi:PQQ-binding-like beta-propeller repeat protein [Nonomuraea phyllanthi]|uniref:outer membrane protein assembly factor BamB family protein n=1 Tax=Nonomuraea phyllanthi TaxID=2219224 RepID=UPI00129414EA|nr:PQQ-binding-like beta-propeller repeat protein [Nonomuraea phyllanthi]QFY13538.1 PQQ-binding-like beta-propeller repeat protein [Nonomuraea phyllanthi]